MRKDLSNSRAKIAAAAISYAKTKQESFTKDEFLQILKEAKCPYSSTVYHYLREENLISINNGLIKFTDNKPIYFGILKASLDEASRKNLEATYSTRNKKKLPENVSISSNETTQLLEAIQLLKSKGYKVLKQKIEFIEC